jgi:hypothetical protein
MLHDVFRRVVSVAAVGALVTVGGTPTAGDPDTSRAAAIGALSPGSPPGHTGRAEHHYRIIGKLRFGLFSLTRDGVGSARMSWQSDGSTSVFTLLAGSDPQRAPRNLNQWGYLREEVRASDEAHVFSLRTLDTDETAPDAAAVPADGARFGLSCASFKALDVNDAQTIVQTRDLTYRMFNELLDSVSDASTWKERRSRRPAGSDAGFLTALLHAIRQIGSGGAMSRPSIAYVYNGTVYDLTVRGTESLGRTSVGNRTFAQLMRSDFAIRNRGTGNVTRFSTTQVPDGTGTSLPVQIFYRPSFWLGIELRLDENADVPAEADSDGPALARIRAICADQFQ